MRMLTVIEFMSLDGVMQGLQSRDEDRDGGFEHGGWALPYSDHVQQKAIMDALRSTTAYRIFIRPLLLGSGKRLFRELPQPKPLQLSRCRITTTGVLLLTYHPVVQVRSSVADQFAAGAHHQRAHVAHDSTL
jgi:hypothetical protein